MDLDDQQLASHLFAKATALLEEAHNWAVLGQDNAADSAKTAQLAITLQSVGQDLAILAGAIKVIASTAGDDGTSNRDL